MVSYRNFSGGELLQQEPDASLPSGGLRTTFEAEVMAWVNFSSLFDGGEKTLCIPTIFILYW